MIEIVSSSADNAASALPDLTDPASLARLEEVARAICLAHGLDPDEEAPLRMICGPNNEPLPMWAYYEEDAQAALAAMPEVSRLLAERRAMVEALGELLPWARRMVNFLPASTKWGDEADFAVRCADKALAALKLSGAK